MCRRPGRSRSSTAIRADGPLLPPLALALAALDRRPLPRAAGAGPPGDAAAGHARAARARRRADARGADAPAPRRTRPTGRGRCDLLDQLARGPRPGPRPRRAGGPGRAAAAAAGARRRGLVDPRLDAPGGRRRAALRALGPAHRCGPGGGRGAGRRGAAAGRPLGPRQAAALAELAGAARTDGRAAPELAGRHGIGGRWPGSSGAASSRSTSASARAGRWPRRPAGPARRPARRQRAVPGPGRGGRAGSRRRSRAGDPTPLLLDGVTGGGKTAIYVEAIAAALERGPAGARARARDRARPAARRSAAGRPRRAGRARPLRPRRRRARRRVAADPRAATSTSSSGRGWRSSRRSPTSGWSSSTRSTTRPTRATGRRGSRPATPRSSSAGWPGAAVVLGSATPAVETSGRARDGRVSTGSSCPARPVGAAADGRGRRPARGAGGRQPRAAVARARRARSAALDTAAGEQAILVLNRRGTASVVLCRDCGHVQACPDCERPLVYHQAGTTLRCHHCGRATPIATRCPACGSPRIRYLGGGTERVEREVRERFPALRVGRLDRDVVERRGAAERVIDAFADGRLDVLVGHEPRRQGPRHPGGDARRRRLGGRRPQPARRAGRRADLPAARPGGRPGGPRRPAGPRDHPDLPARPSGDRGRRRAATRTAFYDAELALRERFGSPPFGRLVKLTVGLADRDGRRARGAGDGRAAARRGPRSGEPRSPSSGRRRPTSPGAPTAGGATSSCAARTRSRCSTAASTRRGRSTSTRSRCSERTVARCRSRRFVRR